MIPLLVFLVVVPATAGDLLTAAGMKRHGEITDWSMRGLRSLIWDLSHNPYILIGIAAMAVSFFALMSLISATPLSFAVPVTASSYILDAILAKYLLKENVTWQRWTGVSLVAIGIALLSI